MKFTKKKYTANELFQIMAMLIDVADSDLVDNRRCFPCKKESHTYYKKIRDNMKSIYNFANYSKSNRFKQEVEGKSDAFIKMRAKIFSEPTKVRKHRDHLLDLFSNNPLSDEFKELVNSDQISLLNEIRELCSQFIIK